jgi:hypothetical protein
MLSRNPRLTALVIETDGTDTNILNAAAAAVGDESMGQLARVIASLYLDSATGQDLDRLVFDRYGLVRKAAAPAIGTVNFSCSPASPGVFSIPSGTLLQTTDGRQFITTAAVTFPALSSGPIAAAVRSTLAGANQQAAIGTITNIVSPIPGAAQGMAVTNTVATSGAADEETDDSLRARARSFFTTARRGTVGAIQNGGLAVAGVQTATAFEVLDTFGRPAKEVELIVTDQFTDSLVNLSPTPPTYQAQSQILAQTVFDSLSDTRAAGIFVLVRVAQVALEGIQLGLRFQAGADAATVSVTARSTIVAYVNSLPPGTNLTINGMISILRTVPGLIVTGNELLAPTGDVVCAPLQVIRTTLALTLSVAELPDQGIQSSTNPDVVG